MRNCPSVISYTDGLAVRELEHFARRIEELGYDSLWVTEFSGRERAPVGAPQRRAGGPGRYCERGVASRRRDRYCAARAYDVGASPRSHAQTPFGKISSSRACSAELGDQEP